MGKYIRNALEVEAYVYETGKGMEDGFIPWTSVITNGWISTEGLVKITRDDGTVVCPFIENRRGMVFIREGDYIIKEKNDERHVCGADSFPSRYTEK